MRRFSMVWWQLLNRKKSKDSAFKSCYMGFYMTCTAGKAPCFLRTEPDLDSQSWPCRMCSLRQIRCWWWMARCSMLKILQGFNSCWLDWKTNEAPEHVIWLENPSKMTLFYEMLVVFAFVFLTWTWWNHRHEITTKSPWESGLQESLQERTGFNKTWVEPVGHRLPTRANQ